MPLTSFQRRVAELVRPNRSPASHLAGGAVINRRPESLRFTTDLEFFHDSKDLIAETAARDAEVLRGAGIELQWEFQRESHWRAAARSAEGTLLLDRSQDSAFRFFPPVDDPDLGFMLHPADVATNKILALVGRSEVRDFLDIVELHRTDLGLGAMIWAA